MLKASLIIFGSIFLGLGIIGIGIPGLPTTPFLLLSAACYLRSSNRLYNWITNHRIFGRYIRLYNRQKGMTVRVKIFAISATWIAIGISSAFFIKNFIIRLVLLFVGIIGTVVLLKIRTNKNC